VPGSPATDAGLNADVPDSPYDQRGEGFPRISNDTVDIGAFEVSNFAPMAVCKNAVVPAGGDCATTVTVHDIDDGSSDPDPGDSITLSFASDAVVESSPSPGWVCRVACT
jgi:hypothetical protein